jgi:hypothetical protein
MPEKRALALEEFKYALERWLQTLAIAWCPSAQLLGWLVEKIFFYEHPESSSSKNIKLQECAVMAINFFERAARELLRPSLKFGGVGIYHSKDRRSEPNILHQSTDSTL